MFDHFHLCLRGSYLAIFVKRGKGESNRLVQREIIEPIFFDPEENILRIHIHVQCTAYRTPGFIKNRCIKTGLQCTRVGVKCRNKYSSTAFPASSSFLFQSLSKKDCWLASAKSSSSNPAGEKLLFHLDFISYFRLAAGGPKKFIAFRESVDDSPDEGMAYPVLHSPDTIRTNSSMEIFFEAVRHPRKYILPGHRYPYRCTRYVRPPSIAPSASSVFRRF